MGYKGESHLDSGYFYTLSPQETGARMLFLKSVLNWVWPVGMMALGVYLLSSSVLTLIYGGMLGVGAFVLGVRMWARVNDDFRQRTETMLKEMLQPKEPAEVTPTVPPQE